ncbi:hypothetical protein SAMN05216382_1810 [Sphingomonas palmae]|uniref:Uncharacterized protein n=2 Tax=Sphingomonas palmae TaxID=1855283 RepID=A0A1H7PBC0_9SPHN|nr:hypothetical protein SAMN05216382_1810 [Sphingomonas palmae]
MLADYPLAPPPSATQIVSDATRLCVASDPATIARRAARAGWITEQPARGLVVAARAPDRDEHVAAGETPQPAERLETCSVFTKAPVSGVDAAVARLLNVAPLFRFAGSSTYRAWLQGSAWRTLPTDPAAFAQARAAGEIYTLIVTENTNGSGVVILNPRPAAALP